MAKRKVPAKLATARAYWRLAAKAERAGNYRERDHWRSTGDRFYRMYQRDQEYIAQRDS